MKVIEPGWLLDCDCFRKGQFAILAKLCACICFVLASSLAVADNEEVDGIRWEYTIDNGEATVGFRPGYWGCAIPSSTSGEIKIPNSLGGCPVVGIGNGAFSLCENITSVSLPETVRNIGDGAFGGCRGLLAFHFSQAVTNIGDSAFSWCENLVNCELPEGLQSIGPCAFQNCTALKRIKLPLSVCSIGEYAFGWCPNLTTAELSEGLSEIPREMFAGCESLDSIVIPSSVTNIGDLAFAQCVRLTSVKVPFSVEAIAQGAFYCCSGLESLTLENGVRRIDYGAFECCPKLNVLEIPPSVVEIGDFAFCGCLNLTVSVAEGNESFCVSSGLLYDKKKETVMFCPCKTESVILPASVRVIRLGAFAGSERLTSIEVDAANPSLCSLEGVVYDKERITLIACPGGIASLVVPKGVLRIDDCACCECGLLESVELPDSLCQIGSSAFSGCTNLMSLVIPPDVVEIGNYAFDYCSRLVDVDIPLGVENLGEGAFRECTSLTAIQIPTGITCIASATFEGCGSLQSVTIPKNVVKMEFSAFYGCKVLSRLEVLSSCLTGWPMAFVGCDNVRDVMVPPPENPLQWYAFPYDNITNLVVTEGVTNIIASAFQGWRELVSVSIPASVVSIGQDVFKGCCKVTDVTMPLSFKLSDVFPESYSNVRTLRLLNGGAVIADEAFSGNACLEAVSIPSGVTRIGDRAFYDCSNLMSVTFAGDAPDVGVDVFTGTPKRMVISVPNGSIGWNGGVSKDLPAAWCGRTVVHSGVIYGGDDGAETGKALTVSVTVTNVVVHYVRNSIQPELTVPASEDTDFVNVIVEVKGGAGAVAIPESWAENYPGFRERFGEDFTLALTKETGKVGMGGVPMFVWQDYVAGTDPTDETDVFRASLTMVEGKPVVSWTPELKPEQAALRNYTIYGKVKLQDTAWQVVGDDVENYNFFKVAVRMKSQVEQWASENPDVPQDEEFYGPTK